MTHNLYVIGWLYCTVCWGFWYGLMIEGKAKRSTILQFKVWAFLAWPLAPICAPGFLAVTLLSRIDETV